MGEGQALPTGIAPVQMLRALDMFFWWEQQIPQPVWSSSTRSRHVIPLEVHTCQTTYCVSLSIPLTTLLAAIWHLLLLWKQPASKHITQHCKQTSETHTSCQCLGFFSLSCNVFYSSFALSPCTPQLHPPQGEHQAGTRLQWSSSLQRRLPAKRLVLPRSWPGDRALQINLDWNHCVNPNSTSSLSAASPWHQSVCMSWSLQHGTSRHRHLVRKPWGSLGCWATLGVSVRVVQACAASPSRFLSGKVTDVQTCRALR